MGHVRPIHWLLGASVLAAGVALVVLVMLPVGGGSARAPRPPPPPPPGGLEWVEVVGRDPRAGASASGRLAFSRTEVTRRQYALCVEAGACTRPDAVSRLCNWLEADRDEHPINCVDWHQARAFAAGVGGRLPTEAEWMFAARDGGPARSYPWGSAKLTCAHARHLACGEGTASVCAADLGLTDAGLCDLLGNVWEWVEDAREDDAPFQVLKGGGFDGARSVTDRVRASPGLRFPGYGFRVVRTVGDDE
jgi:formylglycine-generating enzyme required for sulfatase activity